MTESSGALFERLLGIMATLRGPNGCPWDREQTRNSLRPYLIEEAYEVLEALDGADAGHLQEELGDVLFQVVFHAQIAAELGEFTMAHLLQQLNEKMTRRHPHVFGAAPVATATEALVQWEALKQREAQAAGRPRSVIDGVPRALPALLRAQRLQSKASRVGFDWSDARAAWAKVEEELRETASALRSQDHQRFSEELGDLLFSLVNVARLASLDAEDVLSAAIDKFRRRFVRMEEDLTARGQAIGNASAEELDRSWANAKEQERARVQS